jgi:hypothetical protein
MSIRDEIAAELDGTEYPVRITKELQKRANDAGVVIVYGASDDLMEIEGVISDEIGCHDGGTLYIHTLGIPENECDDDECPYFIAERDAAATIEALWDQDGYSWTYRTKIEHVTFEVVEDGEKYCRGIVFNLADVAEAMP